MSDHIRTDATRTEPRTVNSRYVVTFSASDYATLREWVENGGKTVTTAQVKAILKARMHYG